jgi:hypothetical protein
MQVRIKLHFDSLPEPKHANIYAIGINSNTPS